MIRRNPLGRPSIPYEPTDLRQMSATSIAVAHLGFGAAETGARFDAISNRVVAHEAAEPMIRHADQQAETPIRDDAPTPA